MELGLVRHLAALEVHPDGVIRLTEERRIWAGADVLVCGRTPPVA
jgi:hypothetical protein